MAVGIAGAGVGIDKIKPDQKMLFEAPKPKEITSKKFEDTVDLDYFRYFILNENSSLLV